MYILVPTCLSRRAVDPNKRAPFSYPLPPKVPIGSLGIFHRRNKSSLLSNQSISLIKTEQAKGPVEKPDTNQSSSSFYQTFSRRYDIKLFNCILESRNLRTLALIEARVKVGKFIVNMLIVIFIEAKTPTNADPPSAPRQKSAARLEKKTTTT